LLAARWPTAKRKQETKRKPRLEKIAERYGLKPISLGFFGGFLDFHKRHGLLVDALVRVNRNSLRKHGLDAYKVHDTRDWSNIEAWARQIAQSASSKQ